MKRLFLILSILLTGNFSFSRTCNDALAISFQVEILVPTNGVGNFPRTPIRPLKGTLDGHTLYIIGGHAEFTLQLVDTSGEEDEVVYQTTVPADVNVVLLPPTFTGNYELQLHTGGIFYFFSEIEL